MFKIEKSYQEIKKSINNVLNNQDIEKYIEKEYLENLEKSIEHISNILNTWLSDNEFSKDFQKLIELLKDDYRYTGKIYRGITLLKDKKPLKDRLDFSFPQSFSINKDIAISFADNNMVTTDNEIDVIKSNSEVISVMIEMEIENTGINIFEFCDDLTFTCNKLFDCGSEVENYKQPLIYALDEEEILMLPNMMSKALDSMKAYLL